MTLLLIYWGIALVVFRPIAREAQKDAPGGRNVPLEGFGDLAGLLIVTTILALLWPLTLLIYGSYRGFGSLGHERASRILIGESRADKRLRREKEKLKAERDRVEAHKALVRSNALRALELGVISEAEYREEVKAVA